MDIINLKKWVAKNVIRLCLSAKAAIPIEGMRTLRGQGYVIIIFQKYAEAVNLWFRVNIVASLAYIKSDFHQLKSYNNILIKMPSHSSIW